MMFKRFTPLFIVLVCLLGASFAAAQADTWQAWLYDSASGIITSVGSSGAVLQAFQLPMTGGVVNPPAGVAISPDGQRFAYPIYDSSGDSAVMLTEGQTLNGAISFPVPIVEDSLTYLAGAWVYSQDLLSLAVGYIPRDGGWGLMVMDTKTGAITHTLTSQTATVAILGVGQDGYLLPLVRLFRGNIITFTLAAPGMDSLMGFPSYDWDINSDALTANPVYFTLDFDVLPATGETIFAQYDSRLPAQPEGAFAFGQHNALHVYDPLVAMRFPFYTQTDWDMTKPTFIQGGERVLFDTVDSAGRYAWRVIERGGGLVGDLPSSFRAEDAASTGDGFIYLQSNESDGTATLYAVNSRDGLDAGAPVWTSPAGAQIHIVWSGDLVIRAQPAFPAWAQLAEPVYAPNSNSANGIGPAPGQPLLLDPLSVGVAATPLPSFDAQAAPVITSNNPIRLGALAIVTTTGGDSLNMRIGPGRGYALVQKLTAGTRVSVVDGPRQADGLVWWKIRTTGGVEGWVVESVTGDDGQPVQTLSGA